MNIFESVSTAKLSLTPFLICSAVSLLLGAIVAISYMYKGKFSKSFVITLALLPIIVQVVIMMVSGNLGTAVAVLGAFSLVRFRSVPGSAREITSIFLTMAIGLASGTGYVGFAALFTVIVVLVNLFYTAINFGGKRYQPMQLRVTIPESLDYSGLFDDLFEKYTNKAELTEVKTTNMGSLFRLTYSIVMKDNALEKELIDQIRCRNGNLEISCGIAIMNAEEL